MEGCSQPEQAKGYCNAHYIRARKGTDMSAPIQPKVRGNKCTVPGCGKKHMGRGFCHNHYRIHTRQMFWDHVIAERGGSCERCGNEYPPVVFDFHHRDPSEKRFSIGSAMGNRSWDELMEEVAKCDLLCANCHRILHFA